MVALAFVWLAQTLWLVLLGRLFNSNLTSEVASVLLQIARRGRLPKGGLASCPGNYRPITLLNTDYNILARILATRFGYALQLCVGPHQTAFLQGREIGDHAMIASLRRSCWALPWRQSSSQELR
jgi:hypothetical protein